MSASWVKAGVDPEMDRAYLDALEDDQIYHVFPNFGVREHVTNKRDCWCGPRVEFVEGGAIIIHEVEQ